MNKYLFILFSFLYVFCFGISVDTASVQNQRFYDKEVIEDISEEYQEEVDNKENSLWIRILNAIARFLSKLDSMENPTGRGFWLVILGAILVGVGFLVMKMQKVWIFSPNVKVKYEVDVKELSEDINTLDFDLLLTKSESERNYNLAVRLNFLKTLKMLSDRNIIKWDIHKTNKEYYYQIQDVKLREEYEVLNHYFDVAWYGDYIVSEQQYIAIKPHFVNFCRKI